MNVIDILRKHFVGKIFINGEYSEDPPLNLEILDVDIYTDEDRDPMIYLTLKDYDGDDDVAVYPNEEILWADKETNEQTKD